MSIVNSFGSLRIWAPLVATLLGCDLPLGGCSHTYRERILHLTRVTNATTGQPLTTVFLDSLTYQGTVGREFPYMPNPFIDLRVSLEGDSVRCDLACAFGNDPGVYRFRLSAPGYQSKHLEIAADYDEFHGGCPSWNDEGTRVTTTLTQ